MLRDPRAWSGYLTEAIDTLPTEPTWCSFTHLADVGTREDRHEFLSQQRDMYSYLHDQIAAAAEPGLRYWSRRDVPAATGAAQQAWHTTATTGRSAITLKAIYQRYMGWLDGNPG